MALLAAVLVVALAIGSGLGSTGHQTDAQRAAAIDGQLRCPSCIDATVGDSSASAAVAVRHEVAALVAAGRSNQQIDTVLVARYGPTILLRPPTSGLASLVWIIPSIAGLGAVVAIGALFWKRSREMARLRRDAR